ncbi:hypothetical protein [Alteromonas lipotrueae]|uniref:hypothetical protein n=1 Tax=Alteromonas lipotrueae TaxID=2803814 RepID=UPI001C45DB18|nr:hypothetical protein [Alteromonas lipotrueae]
MENSGASCLVQVAPPDVNIAYASALIPVLSLLLRVGSSAHPSPLSSPLKCRIYPSGSI